MGTKSKIEWTQSTWNPVTGCTKISQECKHCYAETMAHRLNAMGANGYENGFGLSLMKDRLKEPLRRKKPTVYFVSSMSDLFHEDIPREYIQEVFDVIESAHWHTFQVLTKRADRMASFFFGKRVPPNAWIGVSVENKSQGVPRIDYLRQINASVRFLSIEPLLEDLGMLDLTGVHWVIVGGESGSKARPMRKEWVESIQAQCDAVKTPFFFKQWGPWGDDGYS